jgi:polyphosphate glucokinase
VSGPRAEPGNLGAGWVRFDFAKAFDKRVRVLNDAAMQALGGYDGGRMLFLGLGTGVGSALVTEHVVVPLELGNLRYSPSETIFNRLGAAGLEQTGEAAWLTAVAEVTTMLREAFIRCHRARDAVETRMLLPAASACGKKWSNRTTGDPRRRGASSAEDVR